MDTLPVDPCLAYGPLLAVVLAILKRIPSLGALAARNPKVAAGCLAVLSAFAVGHGLNAGGVDWTQLALCAGQQYVGAVATHETVLDPVAKAVGVPSALPPATPK